MWNATLDTDLYSSTVQDINVVEPISNIISMHGLKVLLEQFYDPHSPIEHVELDNDTYEDLENINAEVMALLAKLQDVYTSDSD